MLPSSRLVPRLNTTSSSSLQTPHIHAYIWAHAAKHTRCDPNIQPPPHTEECGTLQTRYLQKRRSLSVGSETVRATLLSTRTLQTSICLLLILDHFTGIYLYSYLWYSACISDSIILSVALPTYLPTCGTDIVRIYINLRTVFSKLILTHFLSHCLVSLVR